MLKAEDSLAEFQPQVLSLPNDHLARHGKVLPYNNDTILILNSHGAYESVCFDMSQERLSRERKIPFNTGGSKLVGLFDRKVLYVFDDPAVTHGFDFLRQDQVLITDGRRTLVSNLARYSWGSTLLQVPHSRRMSSEPTAYSLLPTGCFYMIGGRDKVTHVMQKKVQFFDGFTWHDWPEMQTGCRDAAAVAVPKTEQIVVIGGFGWDIQMLKYKECALVEVFDGQEWSFGPSLNVARQNHAAVVIGDSMVVVLGGVTSQNEPVTEIEVWNMDATESRFLVIPSLTLPHNRCKFPFEAAVHRQQVVYLIGGETTSIDKITFNIRALAHFTLLAASQNPYTILPPPSSSSSGAVAPTVPIKPQSPAAPIYDYFDDRKPPATMKKNTPPATKTVAQNENLTQPSTTTGSITDDNNIILWLPNPPSLPDPPSLPNPSVALTLPFRHSAMSRYIESLETIQKRYRQTIDESTNKITGHYDRLCDQQVEHYERLRDQQIEHYERLRDQQIDLVRFHGTSWLSNAEQRIQEAKQDVKLQEQMFKTTRLSSLYISKFLKANDLDEFFDGIPSQLRCPLTLDLMTDPVVAADGNTYERSALEDWFRNSKKQQQQSSSFSNGNKDRKFVARSPLTGEHLSNEDFFPVHVLRSMCQEHAKQMKNDGTAAG